MEERLRALEQKIANLEAVVFSADPPLSAVGTGPVEISSPDPVAGTADAEAGRTRLHFASLIGRLFLGLAGAFLLRAAVDDGLVPPPVGFALGLAYAAGWLLWSNHFRNVTGSRRGLIHGLLAALIAYPLIAESSVVREFVAPVVALAAAGLITAAFLVVAARLNRQFLAILSTLGALGIGTAVYFGTAAKAPACLLLIAAAALAMMVKNRRPWPASAWIAAIWTNLLLVLPLVHVARSPELTAGGYPDAPLVMALTAGQFVFCVGMFSRRMLRLPDGVGFFEILQTLATMMLAFGAFLVVGRQGSGYALSIGLAALALGAGLYAYSFLGVQKTHGRKEEFYYHSTLALLLVLTGAAFLPSDGPVDTLWMGLALALSAIGARRTRLTLRYHGAAVTLTAILAAGLLVAALPPLTAANAFPLLVPYRLVAAAMVFACGWVLASTPLPADAAWTRRLPTALVFGISAVLGSGLLAQVAVHVVSGGDHPEPGMTALIRTLSGCATAVLMMAMARLLRRPEPGWLVIPLLFALGFKVIIEDLAAGSSGYRFLAFLAYGATWIAAARSVRFSRQTVAGPDQLDAERSPTPRTGTIPE